MFLVEKKIDKNDFEKSLHFEGGGGQGQFGKSLHFEFFFYDGFPKLSLKWNSLLLFAFAIGILLLDCIPE